MMSNLCKGKYLRIEDRLVIEYGLDQNYALKEILVSLREGLNITSRDLKKIDDIISPLIFKGQSISHIFIHINMNLIVLKERYIITLTKMFLQLEILMYQGK